MKIPGPDVSVLMPVYNAAPYLAEAIESVLSQKRASFELLILDDGSADSSWSVIRRYSADPRVRVWGRRHAGIASARNFLLKRARGRFVVNQDSDDVMLPGRLRHQQRCLLKNSALAGVFGDSLRCDPKERPFIGAIRAKARFADSRRYLFPPVHHSSFMFRRNKLIGAGKYARGFRIGEDVDHLSRLSLTGTFRYQKGFAFLRRIHEKSTTHRNSWSVARVQHEILTRRLSIAGARFTRRELHFGKSTIRIQTNSRALIDAMNQLLYSTLTGKERQDITELAVYELPALGGIFPHLEFKKSRGPWEFAECEGGVSWRSTGGDQIGIVHPRGYACVYLRSDLRLGPEQMLNRCLIYPIVSVLRAKRYLFLHAASVVRDRTAVLIAGASYSGKSTLSVKLLERGFSILSDEASVLFPGRSGFKVVGFPRKVKIKPEALIHFPRLRQSHRRRDRAGRITLEPGELGRGFGTGSFQPRVVIFPEYSSRQAPLFVKKLSAWESLDAVLSDPQGFFGYGAHSYEVALEALIRCKTLLKTIPSYYCRYSNSSFENLVNFIEKTASSKPGS